MRVAKLQEGKSRRLLDMHDYTVSLFVADACKHVSNWRALGPKLHFLETFMRYLTSVACWSPLGSVVGYGGPGRDQGHGGVQPRGRRDAAVQVQADPRACRQRRGGRREVHGRRRKGRPRWRRSGRPARRQTARRGGPAREKLLLRPKGRRRPAGGRSGQGHRGQAGQHVFVASLYAAARRSTSCTPPMARRRDSMRNRKRASTRPSAAGNSPRPWIRAARKKAAGNTA